MKFTIETEINLPRNKVIELFDNPENLPKWMRGLEKFEHISGTPGEPGAKSRLVFKIGKRDMELIETITKRNLPDEFNGFYETKGMVNIINTRFVEASPVRTRYITEQEFQFKGFIRFIAILMPRAFKKQSMKYLEDFRKFAESHKN